MPYAPKKLIAMPEPVAARQYMKPNESCWCESGVKWKKCHRIRERLAPVNYHVAMEKLRKDFSKSYCSHPDAPDACAGKIIRAHTVQKSGALDRISEDGHVVSVKAGTYWLDETEGKPVPRKVGINVASTFMGFCSKHDREMFLPIEAGDLPLNRQSAFLMSFRAVALELYQKRASIRSSEEQRGYLDSGRPFRIQAEIQDQLKVFLVGLRYAERDLAAWKTRLDEKFRVDDFSGASMCAILFDGPLPVVATGVFQPEFDFSGNRLQSLMQEVLDQVVVTITYIGDKSALIFCWEGTENGPAAKFVESFASLKPQDMATQAVQLTFAQMENTFVRPSWWDARSDQERDYLAELINVGLPGTVHGGTDLKANAKMPRVEIPTSEVRWL